MRSVLARKIDKLFFEEYKLKAEALGCFRIFFSLYAIFIAGIPDFRILSELPNFIYDPPMLSIASLSSGFPGYYALLILSILIFFLHFFILFGYKTKYASILLSLLMVIGYSFYYSTGKINHSRVVTIWVPLLMGIAGWGKAYSIDAFSRAIKNTDVKGWPVFMLVSLLAFGMFAAGLPKLMGGWLDISTQAVRGDFITNYFILERDLFLAPFFENINSRFFWESLDYCAVFFELGFLIVLFRKKYFQWYVVLGFIFHIANLLMLNISFLANVPVFMVFFPYKILTKSDNKITAHLKKIFRLEYLILISLLFFILHFVFGQLITLYGLIFDLFTFMETFDLLIMILALTLYLAGLLLKNRSSFHNFPKVRKYISSFSKS